MVSLYLEQFDPSQLELTSRGEWRYAGEPFTNIEISKALHRAIVWDQQKCGFILRNGRSESTFRYTDTALFIVNVTEDKASLISELNTGKTEQWYDTCLYKDNNQEVFFLCSSGLKARFTPRTYQLLTAQLREDGEIHIGNKSFIIQNETSHKKPNALTEMEQ